MITIPQIPWLTVIEAHRQVAAFVLVGAHLSILEPQEDTLLFEWSLLIGESKAFGRDIGDSCDFFHPKMISTRSRIHEESKEVVARVELAVVIPTLDEELMIGRCLESVGVHEGVEMVVVDGGSGDRTREAARRAGARVIDARRGRGGQLNAGALATRAERLLFLHADCRLPNGWLAAVNQALDNRQNSLVCFRLRTVSTSLSEPSAISRLVLRLFDLRSHGFRLPYGDQGFAVRRESFDEVGGFEEIPLMEDLVFARACRRLGRVCRLPLEITTTARRFENRPFTTGLMFTVYPILFRLGVRPQTLGRWYGVER